MVIKVLSAFSGYGGAEFSLQKANIDFEVVGYSEIDKNAIKCYDQNHPGIKNFGDITKINPDDIPDFDLFTGGFPCVKDDSLITTQRGLIQIKDVIVGDMVLTHKNRFKKVLKTMNKVSDHYYNIKVQGSPELIITEDHPIYCKKMIRLSNSESRSTNRIFGESNWIKTKDIRFDDFVGFGNWKFKYSANEKNLSNEDIWYIGRYIADGFIQDSKRTGKGRKNSYNHKTIFCIGKHKKEEFDSHIKSRHFCISEGRTTFNYITVDENFMKLCEECGRGAINKKIPFWIMNLPRIQLEIFFNGYMSGDGSVRDSVYSATSISKVLIYQLGQIVHKLYKTPYNIIKSNRPKNCVIEGRTVNQRDTWTIRFCKESHKQDNGIYLCDNMYGRFVSKERINKSLQVYNIEVEDDNSYVANNLIVHNCTTFSIAGKKLGEQDPRGTGKLFYEIIRICEKKQPKWILLENVKGFTFEKFEESFNTVCSELDRIGYIVKHKLINSKNYGTPQSRERIYFVCYRKDLKIESTPFPKEQELKIFIKDILEKEVDKKYYLTEKAINQINEHNKKNEELEFGFRNLPLNKYFVSPTLCSFTMENTLKFIEEENILLDNNHKDINGNTDNREYNKTNPTITTFSAKNLILNKKYRRLTPRECFRLQGFFQDEINLDNLSDSALYKLAGNGWDINTVSQIFDRMFNCKDDNGVVYETYGWVRKTKGYF